MANKLSEIGEITLLRDVIQPFVYATSNNHAADDCAYVELPQSTLLWSMDPCPTPVAALLGVDSPATWGWYTATINVSDIAACGGTPIGLLVSLELPDETEISFVESFQEGLRDALKLYGANLLGGNVKSATRFSSSATIIGYQGANKVTRSIVANDVEVFLVGQCGNFWAGVLGYAKGWRNLETTDKARLEDAVLRPIAQLAAGLELSALGIPVACMDCSDGAANALYQLAEASSVAVVVKDKPVWHISAIARSLLEEHGVSIENACYQFGDWQLACFVRAQDRDTFVSSMQRFGLTHLGTGTRGSPSVRAESGASLDRNALNENFRGGYNSIRSTEDLIEKFMDERIFI